MDVMIVLTAYVNLEGFCVRKVFWSEESVSGQQRKHWFLHESPPPALSGGPQGKPQKHLPPF
eukprot:1159098-Pelagomonas_calceolata.AAC.4